MSRRRGGGGCCAASELLERRWLLATFTVTTAADAGPGSLRQAIVDANTAAGGDEIRFNLPPTAGLIQTIRPLSALPSVTGPTTIDGRTQPGFTGKPLVFLDGVVAGDFADGLRLTSGSSTVRALAIGRFGRHGINIETTSSTGLVSVVGCHVGVDAEGDAAMGNGGAGVRVAAPLPTNIGGPAPVDRNVISANRLAGVEIVPPASASLSLNVRGNYIGTNAAGNVGLGNGREGVYVGDNARGVAIGGEGGNGNVVSGNMASGVRVAAGAAVTVQGNRIGTDAFGAAAVPNGQSPSAAYRNGVTATDPQQLQLGGATAALRNLISGNAGDGVAVIVGSAQRSLNSIRVQGNFVGTDATGGGAIPNEGDGVAIIGAASGPTGGVLVNFNGPVSGNLISGNGGNGVRLVNVQNVTVAGNFIGVGPRGDARMGNGGDGVDVTDAIVTVGGFSPPSEPLTEVNPASSGRNVISANGAHGVHALSSSIALSNSYVGTSSSGDTALGNGGHGVFLERSGGSIGIGPRVPGRTPGSVISGNRGNGITVVGSMEGPSGPGAVTIGLNRIGVAAGNLDDSRLGNGGHGILVVNHRNVRVGDPTVMEAGNVIAYNGRTGVAAEGGEVQPTSGATAVGINGNSIFSNGGLGIDLVSMNDGVSGVTPNDPGDSDLGPNGLLNHPTIFSAVPVATGTIVNFRVEGVSGRTYRVEFFASPSPDPSGRGEGRTFLGFQNVTVSSTATMYSATLPAVAAGSYAPAVAVGPATPAPEVRARRVFYNSSRFDNLVAALSPGDDAAIATDKVALLQGQTPTAANVISYEKGVNGIMIDVPPLPAGVTPGVNDFVLRAGNAANPGAWAPAPPGMAVLLRRGAGTGGGDRISIGWPTGGGVRNGWLEVTVLPSERTGLSRPDTFYFGNLIGETGAGGAGSLSVSPADYGATRAAIGTTDATVTNRFDHNRDGTVSPADVAIVRNNMGRMLATPYPPNPTPEEPPLAPAGVWEELEGERE